MNKRRSHLEPTGIELMEDLAAQAERLTKALLHKQGEELDSTDIAALESLKRQAENLRGTRRRLQNRETLAAPPLSRGPRSGLKETPRMKWMREQLDRFGDRVDWHNERDVSRFHRALILKWESLQAD